MRTEAFCLLDSKRCQRGPVNSFMDVERLPGDVGRTNPSKQSLPQDTLEGEKTGGAFLALQRDLEIPPFIVGLVLKKIASEKEK